MIIKHNGNIINVEAVSADPNDTEGHQMIISYFASQSRSKSTVTGNCEMKFELSTEELQVVVDHLDPECHGTAELRERIQAEIESRKELEELNFEDCDSCKL